MDFDTAVAHAHHHIEASTWWISGWPWRLCVVTGVIGTILVWEFLWAFMLTTPLIVSFVMSMYHLKRSDIYLHLAHQQFEKSWREYS